MTIKHLILNLGPEHSRLKPRLFTWIFISCDVGSLILQAAGGGVAAAAGNTDQLLLKAGDDIIIAGIAFQVFTMSVCGVLTAHYLWTVSRKGNGITGEKSVDGASTVPPNQMRLVLAAGIFAYVTILIRCIYRYVIRSALLTGLHQLTLLLVSQKWRVDGALNLCRKRMNSLS